MFSLFKLYAQFVLLSIFSTLKQFTFQIWSYFFTVFHKLWYPIFWQLSRNQNRTLQNMRFFCMILLFLQIPSRIPLCFHLWFRSSCALHFMLCIVIRVHNLRINNTIQLLEPLLSSPAGHSFRNAYTSHTTAGIQRMTTLFLSNLHI